MSASDARDAALERLRAVHHQLDCAITEDGATIVCDECASTTAPCADACESRRRAASLREDYEWLLVADAYREAATAASSPDEARTAGVGEFMAKYKELMDPDGLSIAEVFAEDGTFAAVRDGAAAFTALVAEYAAAGSGTAILQERATWKLLNWQWAAITALELVLLNNAFVAADESRHDSALLPPLFGLVCVIDQFLTVASDEEQLVQFVGEEGELGDGDGGNDNGADDNDDDDDVHSVQSSHTSQRSDC
jgi:hypothetical protein